MMSLTLLSMLLAPELVSSLSVCPSFSPLASPVVQPRLAVAFMQADADVPATPEPVPEPAAEATADPAPEPAPEPAADPEPESVVEAFDEPAMAADPFEMDEGSIAKEALKAEVSEGLAGATPDKAVVGEIQLALEATNPTRSPATSPLLNGKWKILYATGASPGLKALQLVLKGAKQAPKSPSGADLFDLQDAYLTLRAEQPRAETSVRGRFLSFENTVKLQSSVEAESAVRLVETYDAAESEYMSLRLPFQSALQYKRSLLVSYLDEELLVVRWAAPTCSCAATSPQRGLAQPCRARMPLMTTPQAPDGRTTQPGGGRGHR